VSVSILVLRTPGRLHDGQPSAARGAAERPLPWDATRVEWGHNLTHAPIFRRFRRSGGYPKHTQAFSSMSEGTRPITRKGIPAPGRPSGDHISQRDNHPT